MKTLRFIVVATGLIITSVSFGQRVPKNNNKGSGSTETLLVKEYVVKTEKLQTYFINTQIPADFPKYDATLTKEENIEIARNWAMDNKNLFTPYAIEKFEL